VPTGRRRSGGEVTVTPQQPAARAEHLLFVVVVCASAFLIFLVQPIVGKRILPWFGGASAVWTLCLAFYQSALFLGYAYAHLLIRFATPAQQLGVHALAVAVAAILLPVLPGDGWIPRELANPSAQILTMLAANVALPFMVLASTGPLVQAWFARRHPQRSPYPLYAFSNAGSLVALLAYPFVIEPRVSLSKTGDIWSVAFVVVGCLVIACAALAWRIRPSDRSVAAPDGGSTGRLDSLLWFMLSACAVILLMSVTNKLCLDIASIPFLWILPLATYLVTFVVCFSPQGFYRRAPFVLIAGATLVPSVGFDIYATSIGLPMWVGWQAPLPQTASYCALLFAICMILHGELYRIRPPANRLTSYYLSLSAGGALGGLFVGIVAPLIFGDYYELHAGLVFAGALLAILCARDPSSRLHAAAPRWRWAAVAIGACALVVLGGWAIARPRVGLIHQERSFFGVYRVFEDRSKAVTMHRLENGTTLHGIQKMGRRRRLPTSYFGAATGVGLVLGSRDGATASRIGVVGLGIGTLASYAHAGGAIRFYEIDPVVVRIARDDGLFHYLEDSASDVEIILGDGRLALAREQAQDGSQSFDFLIVDAFNSDTIPVHLLTVEAFAHYVDALAPDGLLAVHASSRHFALIPLVARVSRELGLHGLEIVNNRAPRHHSIASQWVWLSRDADQIEALEERVHRRVSALRLKPEMLKLRRFDERDLSGVPVWTDDYSDLLGALERSNGD
jgi:hypothetical protein